MMSVKIQSVQEIDERHLPTEFVNVFCKNDTNKNEICIRSNVKTMDDINKWVTQFGNQTNTQWNARSSKPEGIKIVCSKKFVCHHNGFMKVAAKENKRGLSKNSNCQASILVVVKLNTINTRQKDTFIKKGLQSIITIHSEHNHTLETAETLRFLQDKSYVKDLFFEYFNDRMTITEAKKIHEQQYEFAVDKELILASGSKNPSYRTVQNWYHSWRNLNLEPRSGEGLIEMTETSNSTNLPDVRKYRWAEIQGINIPFIVDISGTMLAELRMLKKTLLKKYYQVLSDPILDIACSNLNMLLPLNVADNKTAFLSFANAKYTESTLGSSSSNILIKKEDVIELYKLLDTFYEIVVNGNMENTKCGFIKIGTSRTAIPFVDMENVGLVSPLSSFQSFPCADKITLTLEDHWSIKYLQLCSKLLIITQNFVDGKSLQVIKVDFLKYLYPCSYNTTFFQDLPHNGNVSSFLRDPLQIESSDEEIDCTVNPKVENIGSKSPNKPKRLVKETRACNSKVKRSKLRNNTSSSTTSDAIIMITDDEDEILDETAGSDGNKLQTNTIQHPSTSKKRKNLSSRKITSRKIAPKDAQILGLTCASSERSDSMHTTETEPCIVQQSIEPTLINSAHNVLGASSGPGIIAPGSLLEPINENIFIQMPSSSTSASYIRPDSLEMTVPGIQAMVQQPNSLSLQGNIAYSCSQPQGTITSSVSSSDSANTTSKVSSKSKAEAKAASSPEMISKKVKYIKPKTKSILKKLSVRETNTTSNVSLKSKENAKAVSSPKMISKKVRYIQPKTKPVLETDQNKFEKSGSSAFLNSTFASGIQVGTSEPLIGLESVPNLSTVLLLQGNNGTQRNIISPMDTVPHIPNSGQILLNQPCFIINSNNVLGALNGSLFQQPNVLGLQNVNAMSNSIIVPNISNATVNQTNIILEPNNVGLREDCTADSHLFSTCNNSDVAKSSIIQLRNNFTKKLSATVVNHENRAAAELNTSIKEKFRKIIGSVTCSDHVKRELGEDQDDQNKVLIKEEGNKDLDEECVVKSDQITNDNGEIKTELDIVDLIKREDEDVIEPTDNSDDSASLQKNKEGPCTIISDANMEKLICYQGQDREVLYKVHEIPELEASVKRTSYKVVTLKIQKCHSFTCISISPNKPDMMLISVKEVSDKLFSEISRKTLMAIAKEVNLEVYTLNATQKTVLQFFYTNKETDVSGHLYFLYKKFITLYGAMKRVAQKILELSPRTK